MGSRFVCFSLPGEAGEVDKEASAAGAVSRPRRERADALGGDGRGDYVIANYCFIRAEPRSEAGVEAASWRLQVDGLRVERGLKLSYEDDYNAVVAHPVTVYSSRSQCGRVLKNPLLAR